MVAADACCIPSCVFSWKENLDGVPAAVAETFKAGEEAVVVHRNLLVLLRWGQMSCLVWGKYYFSLSLEASAPGQLLEGLISPNGKVMEAATNLKFWKVFLQVSNAWISLTATGKWWTFYAAADDGGDNDDLYVYDDFDDGDGNDSNL